MKTFNNYPALPHLEQACGSSAAQNDSRLRRDAATPHRQIEPPSFPTVSLPVSYLYPANCRTQNSDIPEAGRSGRRAAADRTGPDRTILNRMVERNEQLMTN